MNDEHVEPSRAKESGATISTAAVTVVGLALVTVAAAVVTVADLMAWGIQLAGRGARRQTERALVWLIGKRQKPTI